ncbi:MAG: hypothetical protein BM564_10605 [Bacteroidetes bacterium MedPE-SWsnd-G2]|nr:MAG: hypothetical protein BM564_10605 [Bacteroidetes bacterium MedPE-SWsnd-G2]
MISLFLSCSSDDDGNSVNDLNQEIQNISSEVMQSNWVVTYFWDSDHEETNHFNGYTFNFNSNGSLVAQSGNNTYQGTWSVTNDSNSNSNDDSSDDSNDIDFNIFFGSPSDFQELSDDWDIISHSATKIELRDVSGGNGGTDFLTFEKI